MSIDKNNSDDFGTVSSEESVEYVRTVAHKFNNILGIILGHSELIRIDGSSSERTLKRAEEISSAASRGHELSQRLIALGGGVASPVPVDIIEVIAPLVQRFRDSLGDNVKFVESFCAASKVLVDPYQLLQAVAEILINGREFSDEGVLLLTVSEEPLPESIIIPPTVVANRWMRVRVEDSGVGFEGRDPKLLLEPYFSTRLKGLGLGLAVVKRIVCANGIGLDASGEFGGVFDLFLPVFSGVHEQLETPIRSERLEVWIVEDEESLLEFMKESLEMEGYAVRAFTAPTDLLEVLQPGAAEKPDLLLLDVALPEMSGPELLEEIHQRGWNPKVLWSSGYKSNARLTEIDGNSSFLQKPYTPGDLVDAVRRAT